MKHEELQVIKDRYEKAASGPWEFKDDNEGTEYRPFWVVSENNADSGEWLAEIHVGSELDAEFIAHARQDVPALIAEVEQLREALEFYASTKTYEADVVSQWEPVTPINQDLGETARNALDGE